MCKAIDLVCIPHTPVHPAYIGTSYPVKSLAYALNHMTC